MNDSLFLLQCVLLLLPLTVLTTTRLSVAGATESTSQLHGIELLLNLRDRWKESIQREASLGYHTIISCVLCFIAASVSSAGGVSGGSLFLPILNLVAGLDLKVATTYSAFMVTGGSLANVLYNVILTNHGPEAAKKPLINYDIALLSQPSMLAGVSLGVICNIMFPEWLIVVLFAVFLACSTYRTCKAGLRCWNSETQEMERSDGCGWEGNGGAEGANGGVEEALLGGAPEGRMMRFPWEDTVVLAMVWALFFLLHLLIGGKHGKGAMNLKPCGVAYWSITFSQVPLSIAFTLYVLYEKKKKKKKNCRQQEEGEDKAGTGMAALPMFVFPSAALSFPVLIHDGKPVCESLIIVQYIDESWPHRAPLLPADPYARAHARFWADFIDKKIYDCGTRLWKLKGEGHSAAKEEFTGILKLLEGELGDKKYFAGDAFGFVDIALVPFVCWFYSYETYAGFSIEELAPKLVAWGKRCMERESVAKTLSDPHKVFEFVGVLKKRFGVE